MNAPPIYIVSGGVGNSGEQVVRTALAQFRGIDVSVVIVPRVNTVEQIREVVERAAANRGTIVHTFVDGQLRNALLNLVREYNVTAIDLMGHLITHLTNIFGVEPLNQPGLYHQLRRDYFDRVAAIEFAVKHDDGRNAADLDQADIVITGVSRVGKTPLSMFLSMQGWKVANVPLVRNLEPPSELFEIDSNRVVGLLIEPGQLVAHRRQRQKRLGTSRESSYTDATEIYEELDFARKIFRQGGFLTLDITDRPIEETADDVIAMVMRHLPIKK